MTYLMDEVKTANKVNYFNSKGKFQISVCPEMFHMFSSGLYSNPIKAIVREYYTNGYDSQKEAGVDRPIDVQLPTVLDPVFMIRDYGTGMSREKVETVYQTYGASTKRDTNLATGKFGLGSKAALSYVNSFAVISYYQGKRYKYLVVLDEEGVPELLYDGQPTDTDEPSGLMVQFNVNVNDIKKFTNAAQEVYRYFDTLPNFIGDNKPEITPVEYVMEGDEGSFQWKVKKKEYQYSGGTSHIIMGGNCYPLGDELDQYDSDNIDYYVEMDTFEPTPSRESISWTNKDITTLRDMRELVRERIVQRVQSETSNFTTWEKLQYYAQYQETYVLTVLMEKDIVKRTCCNLTNNGRFQIRASYENLIIESSSVNIRLVHESSRSSNHILHKNCGSTEVGKLGGILLRVEKVIEDKGLHLVVYDVRGIQPYLPLIPVRTVIFGESGSKDNTSHLKELTDCLDKQRIPYKVSLLSDILKTLPASAAQPSRRARLLGNDEDAGKCTGVFALVKDQFCLVPSIDAYNYYVEFDDESTFNLDKFLSAYSPQSIYLNSGQKPIVACLNKVGYNEIAVALGMKKDISVCYIRPRFTAKYAKNVKSLSTECYNKLKSEFEDNWHGFMIFLVEYRWDRYRDKSGILSEEVQSVLNWLQQSDENRNAEVWPYLQYPLLAEIAKSLAEHRWNASSLGRYLAGRYRNAYQSEESGKIRNDYNTLTSWMFDTTVFAGLYKNWLRLLHEEVAALRRAYPYLFVSDETLLFNSLIYRRPNK